MQVLYAMDEPIRWIPQFIGFFMEFLVSMRRVQKFLLCEEINTGLVDCNNQSVKNKDVNILIEHANFSWGGKKVENKDAEEAKDGEKKKDSGDAKAKVSKHKNKESKILLFVIVFCNWPN